MAKAKRNEEEIWATCEELPLQPPEEVLEEVKEKRLKAGVMIYRSSWWTDPLTEEKEQTALVHCTVCGQDTHLQKVNYTPGCSRGYSYSGDKFGFIDPADNTEKYSGNVCICPKCQTGMNALHISKIRNEYAIDSAAFMTASVVRNHYVLLGWIVEKKCNKAGKVWHDVYRTDAMTVIEKSPVRFTGYVTVYNETSYRDNWIARPNYFTDYDCWDYTKSYGLQDKDTAGTELEKSGIIEFFERSFHSVPLAAYLKLWVNYPNVENLVRSGNGAIVKKVIEACTAKRGWDVQRDVFYIDKAKEYLNFKKVKPHEMIGVEKDELTIVKGFSLKQLALFKKVKEIEGVRLSKDEARLAKQSRSIDSLIELVGKYGQGIGKILRYLDKQYIREKDARERPDLISPGYLDDYWRMTKEVYNGKIPKELLYPKSLRQEHDRIAAVYESRKSTITNKKIKAYALEMGKFNFQDEETGLLIRPIATQAELIKEGKTLVHCVASYAERYAQKQTCIFAIRRITAPTKPFFTLEFRNNAVIQNRGYKNCARTDEVTLFEEKWLNFIKKQGVI